MKHQHATPRNWEENSAGQKPGTDKKRGRIWPKKTLGRNVKQAVRSGSVLAVALGLLLTSSPAQALTITNDDSQMHVLVIVEKGKTTEHVLEPSQILSKLCAESCEIFVETDPTLYDAVAGEIAIIKEGQLLFQDKGPVKASHPGN